MRLEEENNDIRRENEHLKDKLITLEIRGEMSLDRSFGGGPATAIAGNHHQVSSIGMAAALRSQ